MTWTNPPPSVVNARDTLLLCATVTGTVLPALTAPQRIARCHYPHSDARSDAMPLFVFGRDGYTAKRISAINYQDAGRIIVHLYVDDETVDDGTLEAWAEGIVCDLTSLGTAGIQYVLEAECGEAVQPHPAQLAASVTGHPDEPGKRFRVISISWSWEG